jgi:2-amino-4-hydroxy-6-hydroxymethyldihydropteridine diphosphokinase
LVNEQLGIFIALGSNLGDRTAHLQTALRGIGEQIGKVRHVSSFHETKPDGGPPQPNFLNAVCELDTELEPAAILERLHALERAAGRERGIRNGPRPLDLDLLIYHDMVLRTPTLTVPHPRMLARPFVMAPLAEICDAERLAAIAALASATQMTQPPDDEDGSLN